MLLNSQALANIQITCPAQWVLSSGPHQSGREVKVTGGYKTINLSDMSLEELMYLRAQAAVPLGKGLINLRGRAERPLGNREVGVSCLGDFNAQDLGSNLNKMLTKIPFSAFESDGVELNRQGVESAVSLLDDIIRYVVEDLKKIKRLGNQRLGTFVTLSKNDFTTAHGITKKGGPAFTLIKSNDKEAIDDLRRNMSAQLSYIVDTVHLTTAKDGIFGGSFDTKPLADMTLPQLETHLATMKSENKTNESFPHCGVSSESVGGQAAMQKLGIKVAVGKKNNKIVSGSGRDEMESLERIMKMLRGAALACADEGKIADPEKIKVRELAVTYLNDTPAGILVSEEVRQSSFVGTAEPLSGKMKPVSAGVAAFAETARARTQQPGRLSLLQRISMLAQFGGGGIGSNRSVGSSTSASAAGPQEAPRSSLPVKSGDFVAAGTGKKAAADASKVADDQTLASSENGRPVVQRDSSVPGGLQE